jgi:hypothetical protein
MPLRVPNLSDQTYQGFLNEALARIPVHNPEWTNFNDSDPGVTLVQLFAFLADNFLYRSNRVPEVNRRKFLSLLGIPLQAATPARAIVTFSNERGPLETLTLPTSLEVRAGQVPFRTTSALDVLPIEWRMYYKQPVSPPPPGLIELYRQLYLSFGRGGTPPEFTLFRTVPLNPPAASARLGGVSLGQDTVDGALWIALLKRAADRDRTPDEVRDAIEGRTLNLGLVPRLADAKPVLSPIRSSASQGARPAPLRYEVPAGGSLLESDNREPRYRQLEPHTTDDPLTGPAIVQLSLPSASMLRLWDNIEPLEPGVGNLPPPLDDTNLNDRLVTWIRVRLDAGTATEAGRSDFGLVWAGLNAVNVGQRAHVAAEALPPGTGEPDQVAVLSHAPVVARSVRLTVTTGASSEPWDEIDDLLAAGPEIPVVDPRLPPGAAPSAPPAPDKVFVVDLESGELKFGDGLRGRRPPFNAILQADYDYSVGRAGNVGPGAINTGPALPAGFRVTNPLRSWGGTDSESPAEGEKQISRYLQHRERLVTLEDWLTITRRTPGVEIGRVEIVPAYNPDLAPNEPGDAPGAVTVMVIPRSDSLQPDAPRPDRLFLDAICRYLDQRRLVTTEVFLRGPDYQDIWVSIGIRVDPGFSVAGTCESVKSAIRTVLSPLPPADQAALTALTLEPTPPEGWPLTTPVVRLHLQAIASRVKGVFLVNDVLLAHDSSASTLTSTDQVDMIGLQLPRIAGISVVAGDPLGLDDLRAQTSGRGVTSPPITQVTVPLPVPVIPQECQ